MASKRKQDDKHLKQLREMVSREHNKTCFECNQRGPTYVDMTIGTFVCTACSGILRGINPPHRVKSISMASYTAAEMASLEKSGNEACRHIWLGLYDSKSQPGPESKEDGKVRDYLVQKYEKKRWYVEPSQAAVLAAAKAKEASESAERKSTSSSHSTPEPKPLKSLIGSNAAPIKVLQPPGHSTSTHNISKPPTLAQTANKQKSVDLLADLGGDPFASTSQPAAQAGGFGQAPFGQTAQQSPFGQPAQQAGFGQQQTQFGQQAAFGQPAQQGGFADFNQAFGGPPQSSQAFPDNTKEQSVESRSGDLGDLFFSPQTTQQNDPFPDNANKESFATSSSSGDLGDLFFPPQTTQQNDPFMPAQPAAGSAPSTNNFGAFESAFTPQSAPVPVVSSAPLNPTVQGLQGLSIANASPPSGGAAGSVGSSGGDKYAAFASLDSSTPPQESASVNWSGGGGGGRSASGVIDWGGGSNTSSTAPKTSSSSGFDWAAGMAKSSPQAFPGTASASATSLGTPSTSSSQLFGSAPFGAQQGAPQGNPFMAMSSSGATQPTSTMANNPFLAGGTQGAPAQANGLFGMQPAGVPGMPAQNPMMMAGAGGAFNQPMPQQQPGANMQMNGRVGAGFPPQGQFGGAGGFGAMPQGAMPNQFAMGMPGGQQPQQTPQGGMGFGGAGMAAMAGLQFNKMGQPQQQPMGQFGAPQQPTPQGQQQQMAAWGAAPNAVPQQNPMAPNPFMMQGGGGFGAQAALPPKSSNTSNPFL